MAGPNPGFQPPAGARPPYFGQQPAFPPGSRPPFTGNSQPPPQNMSGLPPSGPRPLYGPPGSFAGMPPMSGAAPTQAAGAIQPQFSNPIGAPPPAVSGSYLPPQSQGPPGPQYAPGPPPTPMSPPFSTQSALQRPPLQQQQAQPPMPPMANRYPPQQLPQPPQLNSPVYPSQQQPATAKTPVYPQPTTKAMEGLNQNMNNMSVTHQGFNRLWTGTMDSYDLMQMRNILPPTKVEPPKINLQQAFIDASNCSAE